MVNLSAFPKVSVVITTYNGEKYIGETIESVRNQTWQNWELIIVDDGSDDTTCAIITGIKDERIFLHKAGRTGINSIIKNIGLSKVSGELIAFIDHDDLWAPAKLEKQVAALQQYPGAGFSLAGGYNFKKINEPLDYFYKQRDGIKYDDVFISFFKSEVAGFAQALLLRKECLAVAGTFKGTQFSSDANFIISLARHFKAVIIYEPLVYRRIHDDNYTHSNREKSFHSGIQIIREHENILPSKVARGAYFRAYINFGEKCLLYKERRKAIDQFVKAWRNKPFSIVPAKKIGKAILGYLKK
jgi:glycosyltransferase involved in cell wall biosynthesis